MLKELEKNPIITGVKVCDNYLNHSGASVFSHDCAATQKTFNHYAILTKYDRKTDNAFWMKDSRGTSWGDNGYIKFTMNKTDGQEGILGVQKGPWYSASFTKGTADNLTKSNATSSVCPGQIGLPTWPIEKDMNIDV